MNKSKKKIPSQEKFQRVQTAVLDLKKKKKATLWTMERSEDNDKGELVFEEYTESGYEPKESFTNIS